MCCRACSTILISTSPYRSYNPVMKTTTSFVHSTKTMMTRTQRIMNGDTLSYDEKAKFYGVCYSLKDSLPFDRWAPSKVRGAVCQATTITFYEWFKKAIDTFYKQNELKNKDDFAKTMRLFAYVFKGAFHFYCARLEKPTPATLCQNATDMYCRSKRKREGRAEVPAVLRRLHVA